MSGSTLALAEKVTRRSGTSCTAPDASKWPNILHLCELLFSLPFSNGDVERMFSVIKIIKRNRRTNLKSIILSDHLGIKAEGPPLATFSADQSVTLVRLLQNHSNGESSTKKRV